MPRFIIVVFALVAFACNQTKKADAPLTEFSNYYNYLPPEAFYSQNVGDTFKIFKATPQGYNPDSARTYPLIVLLDANAFFESTVTEMKFNSYIGLIPKSIVIGIGYKNFTMMDSLRSRDYTYPVAIPEYEMALSGGADKMKAFIDQELLPKLSAEFKIDKENVVLCGHSLGGYFALYYGLTSIANNSYPVKNIVAVSPSLHYNNNYLPGFEKTIAPSTNVPLKIYLSAGSEDETGELLRSFTSQITPRGVKITSVEYSNFGHIDAALPGFIKGLTFIFTE
ncbi:MAG TPA: alpha/beta hydrolase-fold protein [Cyclobacteriaceae bacterium]|nr:alpha/beta hydrolase-fold protein [Cyclobacteriaceae bacterium]